MVYIPTRRRRHPVEGVIAGGAAVVIFGLLFCSTWPEARALLAQKEPDRISVHDAVHLRRVRWVTVEGQWDCDRAITVGARGLIAQAGSIGRTEVPITGAIEGEVLVASFNGDAKCGERAGASLTGVVKSKLMFRPRGTLRRWRQSGQRVVVMDVGASPRLALIMLLALAAVGVLAIGLFWHYVREMLRSGQQPAPLPTVEPIQ